jgi:hypothetical protein
VEQAISLVKSEIAAMKRECANAVKPFEAKFFLVRLFDSGGLTVFVAVPKGMRVRDKS